MKRLSQFICMLAVVALMASCSEGSMPADKLVPNDPSTPDVPDLPTFEGDTVAVRIATTSLEWDAQPMSRAGSNDLYGLMVYYSPNSHEYNSPRTLVAEAVFDNPSLITLKLAKNRYYHMRMTYIPNGKNVIASRGSNKWGCPFYAPYNNQDFILNQVLYKIDHDTFLDMPSQVAGQTQWMLQYNYINEVLRYEGQIRDFMPVENGELATIPLYRWQYGIRITATDFKEGTVYFAGPYSESRKITLTPNATGTSTKECLLEYFVINGYTVDPNYKSSADYADAIYEIGVGDLMKIGYITPTGEDIILWSAFTPFKRMNMHVLEFSVADAIANGGIQPELMESTDEPMTESKWEL